MFPAARIGDPITHDMLVPSGLIGPQAPAPCPLCASQLVMIEMLPAAHMLCTCICTGATSLGPLHPPIPGPQPPIVKGSPTVLIHMMPAARWAPSLDVSACGVFLGDLKLAAMRTVLIGDGGALVLMGTPAEQNQLAQMVDTIRNSGPKGKAFIEALEKGPGKTRLFIGTSAVQKNGTVISLAATGGGVTIRPGDSKSGDNEVHVDPTNLINYTATDGTTVTETPEGLLAHEMGHAKLLNDKDPAQTTGGPAAEANVRTETNPIRTELGMKPER